MVQRAFTGLTETKRIHMLFTLDPYRQLFSFDPPLLKVYSMQNYSHNPILQCLHAAETLDHKLQPPLTAFCYDWLAGAFSHTDKMGTHYVSCSTLKAE